MELKICSREFFSYYIFHCDAKELSKEDSIKALITSICLGIICLGMFHAICAIKYKNRKYLLLNKEEPNVVNQVYQRQKKSEWTYEELLHTNELDKDEIYTYASMFKAAPKLKLTLMEKAANMNHPRACWEVGMDFSEEKDLQTAFNWFKKGAELKDPSCCQALMNMYLQGQGVEKNLEEAEKWGLECLKFGKMLSIHEGKFSHIFMRNATALKEYFSKLNQTKK